MAYLYPLLLSYLKTVYYMNTRDKQRTKTKSFPDATFKDLQWMEQAQQSPEQNWSITETKGLFPPLSTVFLLNSSFIILNA